MAQVLVSTYVATHPTIMEDKTNKTHTIQNDILFEHKY